MCERGIYWVGVLCVSFGMLFSSTTNSQTDSVDTFWYVTPSGDDHNACSDAIATCASITGVLDKPEFTSGDTILVATGLYTSTASQVVLFNKSADLSGGWDSNFTSQEGISILDGEHQRLVLKVPFDSAANLERFIIQNGQAEGAAGVYNEGWFSCRDCILRGNTDIGDWTSEGGAIRNATTMILYNTTVYSNTSSSGAGIFNARGSLRLNNSTISDNHASGHGGGINNLGGDVSMYNVTITNNTDSSGAGGIHNEAYGTVQMQNTILAGNTGDWGQDCHGTISSLGYNLLGSSLHCEFNPAEGDLLDMLPGLDLLHDNGGPTPTHALLIGSSAIEAGHPDGCVDYLGGLLEADQRGQQRIQRCDIGAYEFPSLVQRLYLPVTLSAGGNPAEMDVYAAWR